MHQRWLKELRLVSEESASHNSHSGACAPGSPRWQQGEPLPAPERGGGQRTLWASAQAQVAQDLKWEYQEGGFLEEVASRMGAQGQVGICRGGGGILEAGCASMKLRGCGGSQALEERRHCGPSERFWGAAGLCGLGLDVLGLQ